MRRLWTLVFVLSAASTLNAQSPTPPPTTRAADELVRVFLDCESMGCDSEFFRTEITWVNFVRDRKAAGVHVLVTAQATGSDGRQYTVLFDGQDQYAGLRDSVVFNTRQGDTDDEIRRQLARTFAFGLLRYARSTAVASRLQLTLAAAATGAPVASVHSTKDRWNLWVYSISANTFANGDANYTNSNVFSDAQARRVTEQWKLSVGFNASYSQNSYKLSSGTISNYQHSYGTNALAAKSISAHWSAGLMIDLNSSKYENYRSLTQAFPEIEWDLFPYKESTRRQLIVRYGIGLRDLRYDSTTIYGKLTETRPVHDLTASAEARQKWGSLSVGVGASQYLDDPKKYRASVDGSVSWRIVRGLEFNVFGSYSLQRDQLNIARGELADEDILVRQRQLQSGYSYFGSVGLSYTFGSMFNNVVNPRFQRGGRSFMMRM